MPYAVIRTISMRPSGSPEEQKGKEKHMNKKDQKKAKGKAVSKIKDLKPRSEANVKGGIAVGDSGMQGGTLRTKIGPT
jgi:hypothetical protein